MSKIIVCRGIPGSGKSTWAKQYVALDPSHRVRYNWDDLRNMLGPYWVTERENTDFLKRNRDAFLSYWMKKGWDIVIDNMNLNPKDIAYYEDLINFHNNVDNSSEFKYTMEFQDFFIPIEECIRRDKLRSNPIGEKVIKDIWRRYRSTILEIENRKLYDRLNSQNKELPHCILVDLDATVALNLSGRPFYGEGCAEGIKNDYPIEPIISIVENYPGLVIFMSGREGTAEIIKASTMWIEEHIKHSYQAIFRHEGDYSSGEICKLNLFNEYIKDRYFVDFILEDSTKVVNMYRELGLTVLQPNEGKF